MFIFSFISLPSLRPHFALMMMIIGEWKWFMSQASSTLSFKWVMNFKILYCHKYQMNPFQPLFFVLCYRKILQKKAKVSLVYSQKIYLMLLQFNLNIDLRDTKKMNDGFIILITTQLCWFFLPFLTSIIFLHPLHV